MGSIFKRGDRWYLSFKDANGAWKQASAETTDEAEAKKLLRAVEDRIAAQHDLGSNGPILLRQYATQWIDNRRRLFEADGKQFRSWKGDRSWLDNHVLPKLGDMQVDEVRPKHLARFFFDLRANAATKLAPHSLRNIYGVLCSLFRDAAVAGLIDSSPRILTDVELGKDDDVDPVAQSRGPIQSPRPAGHARLAQTVT